MAEINREELNRIQQLLNNITQNLSSSNNNFDAILRAQKEYAEVLRTVNKDTLNILDTISDQNNVVLKQAIEHQVKLYNEAAKELRTAQNEEIDLKSKHNAVIESLQNEENFSQTQYLQDKRRSLEEEIRLNEEKQRIEEAYLSGDTTLYSQLLLAQELRLKSEQETAEATKQLVEEAKQRKDKIINTVFGAIEAVLSTAINTLTNSIDRVTDVYNNVASDMSAALNSSVQDISEMQHNIASTLRSSGLNAAISNVNVLNEAAKLVQSGYTNTEKLEQSALNISIGEKLAPNLDFSSNSVKNLINVFGSDFVTKFSAIQQAVQETAGSTASLNTVVNTLTTSLEPVFQNAEYQSIALQDTSDIAATLSAARETGEINEVQEKELVSAIAELMDPSKAFSSSNYAVRVAATNYDFGSGSPLEAMRAILAAQEQYYSNFDMSNSYYGNVSRSLGAAKFGNDTMSATYNPSGLFIDVVQSSNLDGTYSEGLENLSAGEYTTQSEKITNLADNSSITQSVADFAKTFPKLYSMTSTAIIAAINSIPRRLKNSLFDDNSSGGIGKSIKDAWNNRRNKKNVDVVGDVIEDVTEDAVTNNRSLSNIFNGSANRTVTNTTGIATTPVTGSNSTGIVKSIGQAVGGRTGGLAMASYGAGIVGAINIGSDIVSEGEFNAQSLGANGDMLSSATNWGGVGAAIGSLIAPGVGTAIGAFAGAAIGLTTALWAQHEIEKENTEAMEELTQSTKDVLGEGVTAATAMQAKAEIAKGGGTIELNSGTYLLDMNVPKAATGMGYVPYDDFLVKLHKGEAVVTASAADKLRRDNPNFWTTPSVRNDDVVFELERQTKSIVNAIKGDNELLPMQRQGQKSYTIQNATT